MSVPRWWTTVAEAVEEVRQDDAARTAADSDWWDPTDSAWWAECPQIGDLDPAVCAARWRAEAKE